MRDFALKDFQAAGIVGNLGRESAGFTQLREIGAAPGRGGYGWCQWTGPRARAFLNWCHLKGLDWTSDKANYGYLRQELNTDYAYVVAHMRESGDVASAAETFERFYERAGVPDIADRVAWARAAYAAYHATAGS